MVKLKTFITTNTPMNRMRQRCKVSGSSAIAFTSNRIHSSTAPSIELTLGLVMRTATRRESRIHHIPCVSQTQGKITAIRHPQEEIRVHTYIYVQKSSKPKLIAGILAKFSVALKLDQILAMVPICAREPRSLTRTYDIRSTALT